MEPEKIDYFRKQLVKQRDRVLAEMADHQPLVDRHTNVEEKADQAANHLVETRITENDGNLLQKIGFALERLDAGTYQQCSHCGNEIPLERLKAKPSVSLCIECQEKKDSGRLPSP